MQDVPAIIVFIYYKQKASKTSYQQQQIFFNTKMQGVATCNLTTEKLDTERKPKYKLSIIISGLKEANKIKKNDKTNTNPKENFSNRIKQREFRVKRLFAVFKQTSQAEQHYKIY